MYSGESKKLFMYYSISEYFGTFILGSGISASTTVDEKGNQSNNIIVLIICLFTAINICKNFGGADFNPAVTYLKYLTYPKKHFYKQIIIANFCMQFLGAFSSFLCFYLLNGYIFKLTINKSVSQFNAFVVEILSSICLNLVTIIQDDLSNNISDNSVMRSFVAVAAVVLGVSIGGNISGAGMNPAVALGSNLLNFFITGNLIEFQYTWIYIFSPFIASYITALFYRKVYKYKIIIDENDY